MAFVKSISRASLVAATCFAWLPLKALASGALEAHIGAEGSILTGPVDGRIVLIFAPSGTDPLDDTDVTSSPNYMFGMNAYGFTADGEIVMSGGSANGTLKGVWGWPVVNMDAVPAGQYSVQAFLNPYDKAERSDGSVVYLKFPCGDGAPPIDGVGSLQTPVVDVEVTGEPQTFNLTFDSVSPVPELSGNERGGCSQGNYEDTELLKYVKIRSDKLSAFWGRDMYVGANVLLPAGYNATDKETQYPVLYAQNHWTGDKTSYGYLTNKAFTAAWDNGIINGSSTALNGKPAPKLIIVTFRHEAPYYDDSYAVNTANLGPYGDALNDELIPYLENSFNMIPKPYARVQDGGSTGGWESIANLVFRPDLFGTCFSSYPDSLDFHRHQDIQLYTNENAYFNADGSSIPSIRTFSNNTQVVLASTMQENHWELVFGTSSRSSLQWDVWNAVFGAQGLNNYPLEPWDKVTGEIYHGAVQYWKEFDLANHIITNWDNQKNLGEALRNRIHLYVGTHDDYFLNEGVMEFEKRVNGLGGSNWANVTILEGQSHGGNYQRREIWDYLTLVDTWVKDHSPEGKSPLTTASTHPSTRGNKWEDVIRIGGHQAALARQVEPELTIKHSAKCGAKITATAGRWDPGVKLQAQWFVDSKPSGTPFAVVQDEVVRFTPGTKQTKFDISLRVTGTKRNYADEIRETKQELVLL
ncbi:Alpha/Beta hydrolase protein [Xylariaceae sp. FL1272]|nr:Alpha/Beta hydrolase protein [Xylariaceae sp. FL1272]